MNCVVCKHDIGFLCDAKFKKEKILYCPYCGTVVKNTSAKDIKENCIENKKIYKGYLVRKPLDYFELKEYAEKAEDVIIIEKEIIISKTEFDIFLEHFMKDYEFLVENSEYMYQEDDGYHCILVWDGIRDIKIAVEAEGYSYVRYAALITDKTEKIS